VAITSLRESTTSFGATLLGSSTASKIHRSVRDEIGRILKRAVSLHVLVLKGDQPLWKPIHKFVWSIQEIVLEELNNDKLT